MHSLGVSMRAKWTWTWGMKRRVRLGCIVTVGPKRVSLANLSLNPA